MKQEETFREIGLSDVEIEQQAVIATMSELGIVSAIFSLQSEREKFQAVLAKHRTKLKAKFSSL
jgi:hypothetical protein